MVARLKGNGAGNPILILGHTDTVGVQPEMWPVDPFGAVRKDGYIWGRGTTDNKDCVAAGLMLMLQLKRLRVPLDRDVIYVAEASEESSRSRQASASSTWLRNIGRRSKRNMRLPKEASCTPKTAGSAS